MFKTFAAALTAAVLAVSAQAQTPAFTPDNLKSDLGVAYHPANAETDYVRREVMIPMRDGVKLYTLIVMKKGVTHGPILMQRTPYGADGALGRGSQHLLQIVGQAEAPYLEDGYIRVWQDVRGRNKSEGVYFTNRPLSGGELNKTGLDHATDTYDTVEWLIHNVPESNGKVGVIGGSYEGFLSLMAAESGHPALKAVVPINPMVDVWRGDDWYHNGAFRMITLPVLPIVMATKGSGAPPPTGGADLYATQLKIGSAGDYMRRYNLDAFPLGQRFIDHPAYDALWSEQALDQAMAKRPIQTDMLLVAGMYDEQDLYGAPAVFRALHPLDKDHRVTLLLGPWSHMGVDGDGSSLGTVKFDEDTAARARRDVIKPFLDARLKDDGKPTALPAVISYATGLGGGWRRSDEVPAASTAMYLHAGGGLSTEPPKAGEAAPDEYVSDPAKPVPVLARPFPFSGDAWKTSLIADQRVAGQRTDVLVYETEPLDKPTRLFGQAMVDLFAATTGTDSDFVVKLIDVYPDESTEAGMAGYQLPLAMDIFRGRYVHGLDKPQALTPGKAEDFHFALPMADHVFAKGHRIMVQVQSSWFPVYDRNPQTFVPNIFNAKPGDYRKATQSVFHDPARASAVRLPLVTP